MLMKLLQAADSVAPGGPSAPAWAFFTAITLAVLGILAQQLTARSRLKELAANTKEAKSEATEARKSAETVAENTQAISNGFANRVDAKLSHIIEEQDRQGDALRKHLEWHLEREAK